ncbi:transcriptional regulator [Methanolobus halotolerans]|uniref:Transcriptional regulator n=2 Tax=Methanolobus halotolerans TaxID=2052935 RepID=A0A4E0Q6A8_9EURY|nr:transcriptional regulator [Methanolobus halotolerans]
MFASAKRKHTLLLLKDGPREIESLLHSLETTRQALLPQLKILEESYLIGKEDDAYRLSTIGEMIVEKMTPLIETLDVLDTNIVYWGEHNLNFVPPHLLKRLKELRSCKIITPPLTELYEINKDFFKQCKISKSITLTFTFLYPNFPEIFNEWIDNGVHVTFIASKELFERIKLNYADEFRSYLNSGLFDIFVYDHTTHFTTHFVSFGYNDHCAFFRLLSKKGEYDNKQLMCCSSSAVEWNKELCEYYRNRSTHITEI